MALLENVTGQYFKSLFSNIEPSAKESLSETVVGFSPFVPFSKSFGLRLAKQGDPTLLLPDDLKKDPTFMEQVSIYEDRTGDPKPPVTDASKTVESFEDNPQLKKSTEQIAKLLREASVFAFGESDVLRSNKRYVGEVAFDIVAKDIFKRLPEQYQKDIFDIGLGNEKIEKKGFHTSFDVGTRTEQSRSKLHTFLLSLQQAGMDEDVLRRVGGAELTIARTKRVQRLFEQYSSDGLDVEKAFIKGAKKFVADLNAPLKQIRNKIKDIESAAKLTETQLKEVAGLGDAGYSKNVIYEINQALRRVFDMSVEEGWKGKNTYLYTVPLNTPTFTGQGVAAIGVENRNDLSQLKFVLHSSSMIVDTTIAGGQEAIILEHAAGLLGIESAALNNQWQEYLTLTSQEYIAGIYQSKSMSQAFDPSAPIANSISGYGIMSQVMTNKQLTDAILNSFEEVKGPMAKQAAKVYTKIINEANNLSRAWQMNSAKHIWKGNFDQFQFGMADNRGEVWKGSNYWTDRIGEGMVVSPLIGSYSQATSYNIFKDRVTNIGRRL